MGLGTWLDGEDGGVERGGKEEKELHSAEFIWDVLACAYRHGWMAQSREGLKEWEGKQETEWHSAELKWDITAYHGRVWGHGCTASLEMIPGMTAFG